MVSCTLFPLGYLRKFFGGKTMELKAIYKEIGKTLAPVEIESEEAMRDFGITKKDLVPLMVGTRRVMVYPFPAEPEVCKEMLRALREQYANEARSLRCMVRGVSGRLIRCPAENFCKTCPLAEEFRRPSRVSLDAVLDSGLEIEDTNADFHPEIFAEDFISHLEEIDPRYVTMLQMKIDGSSASEISRELSIPYHLVTGAFGKIRRIASEYFGMK